MVTSSLPCRPWGSQINKSPSTLIPIQKKKKKKKLANACIKKKKKKKHVAYACKYLFIVNNKDVRIIVMILIVDFEQVFPITNNLRLGLFYETMVEQGRTRKLREILES